MKVQLIRLRYSGEFHKYYGYYLPKHSEYLSQQEFQWILRELNEFKPSGLAAIPNIGWMLVLFPIIAPRITNDRETKKYWLLSLVCYFMLSNSREKHNNFLKVACADLTSLVSTKGITLERGPGKDIFICYNPGVLSFDDTELINESETITIDDLIRINKSDLP
ncbi:hypothetical protein HDV06_000747 [Boothiomyces sp. JEL0866]|nr:hypothetical protein HDV06_000747 [Boothiomyces sp. JEL0866]